MTRDQYFGKNENDSQKFGGISDEDTEEKAGYYDHGIFGFRNEDGEIRFDLGEHLPYDADSDVIDIDDDTYAAFYIDSMENPDRYVGKEIRFSGIILNSGNNGEHSFIVGRIAITCCSEDMTVFGFICDSEEENPYITDEWVDIICVMQKEYSEKYELWHPVCKVKTMRPSSEEHKKIINVT